MSAQETAAAFVQAVVDERYDDAWLLVGDPLRRRIVEGVLRGYFADQGVAEPAGFGATVEVALDDPAFFDPSVHETALSWLRASLLEVWRRWGDWNWVRELESVEGQSDTVLIRMLQTSQPQFEEARDCTLTTSALRFAMRELGREWVVEGIPTPEMLRSAAAGWAG